MRTKTMKRFMTALSAFALVCAANGVAADAASQAKTTASNPVKKVFEGGYRDVTLPAGAVIGRLAGGKKGAAEGAVIGGGAGAGYVLSTRGKEVRLGKGAALAVRLTAPVTIRVAGR